MQPIDGEHQRLRHKLLAGLLDATTSSLATFLVGIVAVRNLSPSELGEYGALFSAFLFGGLVPSEGFFLPRILTSMQRPPTDRLEGIARAAAASWKHAGVGCSAIAVAVAVLHDQSTPGRLAVQALAAGGLVFVSPMQDYVRRTFHLAERSWQASVVSATQLLAVAAISLSVGFAGRSLVQLPLVILLIANCLSLLVGFALSGRIAFRGKPWSDPAISSKAALSSAAVVYGASFVCLLLMARISGTDSVGYAEAARTAAQPVLVASMGLSAAFSSRALSAMQAQDREAVKRVNLAFVGLLVASTLAYLAPLLHPAGQKLVAEFLPHAFAIQGLVIVSIVANLLGSSTFLIREQLLKAGGGERMARVDYRAATLPIVAGLLAAQLGAFARPVGLIAQHTFRLSAYRKPWTEELQTENTGPAAKAFD